MIKTYIALLVKYPFFLSDFNETRIFSTDFSKTLVSNLMKIRSVGDQLFLQTDREAGRRTDMTKLVVAFRSFVNAAEK
jgi:hypothetical protein